MLDYLYLLFSCSKTYFHLHFPYFLFAYSHLFASFFCGILILYHYQYPVHTPLLSSLTLQLISISFLAQCYPLTVQFSRLSIGVVSVLTIGCQIEIVIFQGQRDIWFLLSVDPHASRVGIAALCRYAGDPTTNRLCQMKMCPLNPAAAKHSSLYARLQRLILQNPVVGRNHAHPKATPHTFDNLTLARMYV